MIMRKGFSMKSKKAALYSQIKNYLIDIDSNLTHDFIVNKAKYLREKFEDDYSVSDAEFDSIIDDLLHDIPHSITFTSTSLYASYDERGWFYNVKNKAYAKRYFEYLQYDKNFSPDTINSIDKLTDNVMDQLGNPKSDKPFQQRGLILGEVQSGKTATYTAICNKAVDAGYKVIIVLTGLLESLRKQTQSRLDAELVGFLNNTVTNKEAKKKKGKKTNDRGVGGPIGVGKRVKIESPTIMTYTSKKYDFNVQTANTINLDINSLFKNDTTVTLFVVKKQRDILTSLINWLTANRENILDCPLLLIDDEADNASINTNKPNQDPTVINDLILALLESFTKSSYLGITATPFANILIDPNKKEGELPDLFPKDFITLIDAPVSYLGVDKIFGGADEDIDAIDLKNSKKGSEDQGLKNSYIFEKAKYKNFLQEILNSEQENFFKYKHKSDLEINDLPPSLKEAIVFFILACTFTDINGRETEHRSMLVNVTRFTSLQNTLADLISNFVDECRGEVSAYSYLPDNKISKHEKLAQLKKCWEESFEHLKHQSWTEIKGEILLNSIKRIDVTSVNVSTGGQVLDYQSYENNGKRVIAIGGNSLSRGLTLEGLCVSYFYRNTAMYDTLLQMGRWFGYRDRYIDICRLWMGEDTIGWFASINSAYNELTEELKTLAKQKLKPVDFQLRIKHNNKSLYVTARNKMGKGEEVKCYISLAGRLIETPRLIDKEEVYKENERACKNFLANLNKEYQSSFEETSNALIWRDIPSSVLEDLLLSFKCHPWNLNYQSVALIDYIRENKSELKIWDIAIPKLRKKQAEIKKYSLDFCNLSRDKSQEIYAEKRKVSIDGTFKHMLKINARHVRVGAGGCTKIGLTQEEINNCVAECREEGKNPTDRTYLKVANRKPIALIHIIQTDPEEHGISKIPEFIFALSLGFPGIKNEQCAKYVINGAILAEDLEDSNFEDEDEDLE